MASLAAEGAKECSVMEGRMRFVVRLPEDAARQEKRHRAVMQLGLEMSGFSPYIFPGKVIDHAPRNTPHQPN
jgi:hypothetical protein